MPRESLWLLPDGVDEVIPPQAAYLEALRRRLLDILDTWGYELCQPATVEFLDSLLADGNDDLALQTFKLIDQVSGRLLGVPADLTPQIARIDAHRLNVPGPVRLCYSGPILHARPDRFAGSRNPLQLGAELYGHAGIESDAEVLSLMVAVLAAAEVGVITLDIGHMSVFHGLAAAAALSADDELRVLDALLRKSASELAALLRELQTPDPAARALEALLTLNGEPATVLPAAAQALAAAPAAVRRALDELTALVDLLTRRCPGLEVHLDLADLRGYRYHTGVMFAAYTQRMGRAIAWGGRYDDIGARYGRARPATGFSTDLKLLVALGGGNPAPVSRIYAPAGEDHALLATLGALRAAGERVVQGLPGQQGGARELGCTRELRLLDGRWQTVPAA